MTFITDLSLNFIGKRVKKGRKNKENIIYLLLIYSSISGCRFIFEAGFGLNVEREVHRRQSHGRCGVMKRKRKRWKILEIKI